MCIKNLFFVFALIVCLGLMAIDRTGAQNFTNLYDFSALHYNDVVKAGTNRDGGYPGGDLLVVGNTLYGPAYRGGSSGNGTVFRINTDGTGFSNLHSFSVTSGLLNSNTDGARPIAGLVSSGNRLYGTTLYGGSSGAGAVFAVNTDGTSFSNLHSFGGRDGAPFGGLLLWDDTLFGTTSAGTVFKINTDGTGYTILHTFSATTTNSSGVRTNWDGAGPSAGLILSGTRLYGTAGGGGSFGNGTVFAVKTDGTDFKTIHTFAAGSGNYPYVTNNDGAFPIAGLILSGNTLYGIAEGGGSFGNGTVFAVNTNGSGFTILHTFTALHAPNPGTNWDGADPHARLLLSNCTLYGTAVSGGSSGAGVVFKVRTDGTGFATLHNFTATFATYPYAGPFAGLVLSGNDLYGTARYGGNAANGAVYRLSLPSASPPQLGVHLSGTNVVCTWPTDAEGFTLYCTTNFAAPPVWIPVSLEPAVVNGDYAITNPATGASRFYRLGQ
ncbi:MAG: hypothetical protein IH623_26280 [Verrucomicrobia bacterium]|nr:hypothetical protein [Verrucomicrobiota bacterium]